MTRGIIGNKPRMAIITVNGDRYRAMLNEFLSAKIEGEDIGNIWFQQDGVTCHSTEATLDDLRPVFENRIFSRRARCHLATSQLRFDTVGLLFVRCRQRKVLRRQDRDFNGQYS